MESENDGKSAEEPNTGAVDAVDAQKVDEVNDTADVEAEKDHQIEAESEAEKPEDPNEEMTATEQTNTNNDSGQIDEESIIEKDDDNDNSSSVSDHRSVEFTRSNSNSNFSQQDQDQEGDNSSASASFSDTNNTSKSNENGNKNLVETIDIADVDVDMSTMSSEDSNSNSQISSSGPEPPSNAKVPQKTARRKLYNSQGGMGRPTNPNYPSHRMVKDQALFHDTRDFMMGFDPQRRNKQKRRKKYGHDGRQLIFADEFEECDCLRQNCPGCHWPCRVCHDPRCGHECRSARKWLYDTIEIDGRHIEIRNHRNTSL